MDFHQTLYVHWYYRDLFGIAIGQISFIFDSYLSTNSVGVLLFHIFIFLEKMWAFLAEIQFCQMKATLLTYLQ